MNPARRRRTLVVGLAILVTLLVGGRWVALETAERAWAATIERGDVYLSTRDFARLVHGILLLVAVAWGTVNLYYVYASIGSVQLPRRLGDLEIVEAVPQRVLLAGTLACGLLYGWLLTLGTGRWWLEALLASRPPHFGVADPVLARDLGYYVASLPWAVTCKDYALRATTSGLVLVAVLYFGIGSLRFQGWRPSASAHARAHLGAVLALLALTLIRAAQLDVPDVLATLTGTASRTGLDLRMSGSDVVIVTGFVTVLCTLFWALRERPALLVGAWSTFVAVSLAVRWALPGVTRSGAAPDDTLPAFGGPAFGVEWRAERPRGFPTVAAALGRLPVWDGVRVAALAQGTPLWPPHAQVAGSGAWLQTPESGTSAARATWLVVPAPAVPGEEAARAESPEWAESHRGRLAAGRRPVVMTEVDSGLAARPAPVRDSALWFGAGFGEFAVVPADTWRAPRPSGVALEGWWRRTALAWTLQSPELARSATDGLTLLWRRDVGDRLSRLAPFARFGDPIPLLAAGDLWWLCYGYVAGDRWPLARPVMLPEWEEPLRYLRAAVVGVVNAATGDTRLYLAPGADSLATAWARLLAPLIRPADSLPAGLRDQLPFPRDAFRAAAALLARARDSNQWHARPKEPYDAPSWSPDSVGAGRLWTAQAFDSGSARGFAALLAGTMTSRGPVLRLWTLAAPVRLPTDLLGSSETAPGLMRVSIADGGLLTEQGLFAQPAGGAPKGLEQIYLTWGERASNGPTVAAALHGLLASPGGATDTSVVARLEMARRLAAAADSALAAGDLESFGRLYRQLKRLLDVGGPLAPSRRRR